MSPKDEIILSKTDVQIGVFTKNLVNELMHLIDTAKFQVANYANSSLVILYWQIGQGVNTNILKNERAEYGKK